ncbi:hypothetical protein HPP92_010136 [Vanilla planifolia]|uniref:Uncharacterized protein n=1 Tax=Vanilla planifolia TaxID=51239 RepID=A0A835QWL3_VANPL|nr:hypothetical protein HPP92_010136 [Vanilla planifolia]
MFYLRVCKPGICWRLVEWLWALSRSLRQDSYTGCAVGLLFGLLPVLGTHDVHFPSLLLYIIDVLPSAVLKAYGSVICTGAPVFCACCSQSNLILTKEKR